MNQVKPKTVSKKVGLQFKEWDYPSLEDAILTFTMKNGYSDVYSHTSRYKGIDNDLLPDTLIQHKKDGSMLCVYSPYEPLIDRVFQNEEDRENLQIYMNPECKNKVTFKFIPYVHELSEE